MKSLFLFVLVVIAVCLPGCKENRIPNVSEPQLLEMRSTAIEFMKELKGILIKEIQKGSVLNAVSICSDTAQMLTNNFGLQKGIFVKRVSFNNRNSNNFPDEYEKKILNRFSAMHNDGKLDQTTESIEIVEGGAMYLRYMKPILIQAECLNCHGSGTQISPEIKKLISEKYPNDKAINYKVGDLRGAVSIKKVIE
ncbi:MAG: DUF3365 domain-containing protein [Ignavibacteria bacterium]|nr:DUF3365 domain-containing protein [Ignavibacteria bacterium]MBT8382995.1 DUF3365 domain-containing protein [Ignavibacteria bacterium]MBT8391616.1 DUF3365 domain-containing protein [Ignavibacteria bacterium]NNJ53037.1 DUF3365 domain-containing protein [Ignavibacteriaceae bacterium]NNL22009.1 DUF3365 domain-containing protein [Ignavibacteriaceae bacterium]